MKCNFDTLLKYTGGIIPVQTKRVLYFRIKVLTLVKEMPINILIRAYCTLTGGFAYEENYT